MNLQNNEGVSVSKRLFGKMCFLVFVISVSLYLLFAFALSPLIAYVNSDKTLTFPFLPDILDLAFNALNLVAFFSCYAITFFCIYKFKLKKAFAVVAIFAGATVAKYALNLVSDFFIFGSVPTSSADISSAISSVAVNTLVELLQYATVTLIAYCILRTHRRLGEITKKNAEKLGKKYDERDSVFPFTSLISRKNPLQRSAFYASVTVMCILLVQRLFFFIWSLLNFGGITGPADLLWSIAGFIGDVIFASLGYLIMLFVMSKCDTYELTLRIKYDE